MGIKDYVRPFLDFDLEINEDKSCGKYLTSLKTQVLKGFWWCDGPLLDENDLHVSDGLRKKSNGLYKISYHTTIYNDGYTILWTQYKDFYTI